MKIKKKKKYNLVFIIFFVSLFLFIHRMIFIIKMIMKKRQDYYTYDKNKIDIPMDYAFFF